MNIEAKLTLIHKVISEAAAPVNAMLTRRRLSVADLKGVKIKLQKAMGEVDAVIAEKDK
jgi:hypothetical protein